MDGTTLRDGIFALRTRRLGTVGEVLIKRMAKLGKAQSQFHDLYDGVLNHRVEVKFSVVQRKANIPVTEKTVLQAIEGATSERRMVNFTDWKSTEFDCNIQQVKRREFEMLYYGLFFADCVIIFRIATDDIGSQIQYSDFQHKGNIDEGQFHINRRTFQYHLDHYAYRTFQYDFLLSLLTD